MTKNGNVTLKRKMHDTLTKVRELIQSMHFLCFFFFFKCNFVLCVTLTVNKEMRVTN